MCNVCVHCWRFLFVFFFHSIYKLKGSHQIPSSFLNVYLWMEERWRGSQEFLLHSSDWVK